MSVNHLVYNICFGKNMLRYFSICVSEIGALLGIKKKKITLPGDPTLVLFLLCKLISFTSASP